MRIRPDAWMDWVDVEYEDWNGTPIVKISGFGHGVSFTKRSAAELIAELQRWIDTPSPTGESGEDAG